MRGLLLVLVIPLLTAGTSLGQTIDGFIDVESAYNDNRPQSHQNFLAGTGTTAEKADELSLNLAAIEIFKDAKPLGFHLSLVAGTGADVVHSGERAAYRNIYQASVSARAPVGNGLLLTAGIYPSHIGVEGFYSKDNWLYTRSWLGELSPYYQTGICAAYAFNDRWSAQLHVVNGWQNIEDNNSAKTVGTQIAFSGRRLSASFNTLVGPELPNDNTHLRVLGDLVATWKATKRLSVAGSIDRGRQDLPGGTAANWLGIAGYARFDIDARHAVSTRIERFRDPDNGISGARQTLSEGTISYLVRPVSNLILKFEARRDRSTAAVFDRGANEKSRTQTLMVIGVVVTFGTSSS